MFAYASRNRIPYAHGMRPVQPLSSLVCRSSDRGHVHYPRSQVEAPNTLGLFQQQTIRWASVIHTLEVMSGCKGSKSYGLKRSAYRTFCVYSFVCLYAVPYPCNVISCLYIELLQYIILVFFHSNLVQFKVYQEEFLH